MPLELHHLLSIDPGTRASAWCFWVRGPAGWSPSRVDRCAAPTVRGALDVLGGLVPDWSDSAVVVEDQFYVDHRVASRRGYQASPWQDVAALIEVRCRWQHAAELAGAAEVLVARPGTWIPAFAPKSLPGKTSKDRIRLVVDQLLPELRVVRDEYDAVGLGAWWVRERGERAFWEREAGGGMVGLRGDDDAARRAGSTGAGNPGGAGSTPGAVSSSEVGRG